MSFASPLALLLLLPLPALWWLARRRERPSAVAFPSLSALATVPVTWRLRLVAALPALRLAALALCVVALARPQWGVETTRTYTEGIAIEMVVDISSSMGALDLRLDERRSDRLEVVKETFRAFVTGDGRALGGRDADLIGLVTFARYADGLSPLTLDHEALLGMLDQVRIVPFAEEDGTAIGDAIVAAVDRLRGAAGSSRVLILLTDGSNNAGDTDPLAAAQAAQALGIRIYAIGAGTRGMALMPVRARDGGVEFRPAQVFIDEHTLQQIAQATGGRSFRATDAAALRAIYAEIDALEKARNVVEHYQQRIEGFPLALAAALALLLLELSLAATRLRTVP